MLRSIIIAYKYFIHNGDILPNSQASVPLNSVEYSYGYGVYETVRASNGSLLFINDHIQRLNKSAEIIGLEHNFSGEDILEYANRLLKSNLAETCNLKILLIGGRKPEDANLYLLCLNPLFPDRKLYRDGVKCICTHYERAFPNAKTLNMLQSYLAFKKATTQNAYDTLAINRAGYITEGTRTNFFTIKDRTIYTPLESEILLGVTREHVLKVAKENDYEIIEKMIKPSELSDYDGAFLTSTSSKIMPIKKVDDFSWPQINSEIEELIKLFDIYLKYQQAS